jgi:hypothetical protein
MKKLAAFAAGVSVVLLLGTARSDSDAEGTSSDDAARIRRQAVVAADEAVAVMALRGDHVQRWLGEARAKGQKRRAACLDDMLSQVHAVERLARDELGWMTRAQIRGAEVELFPPRLARVAVYTQRSQGLLGEAQACGGKVSRRQRMPTGYEVRRVEPRLPDER